jgi:hypothetical protein
MNQQRVDLTSMKVRGLNEEVCDGSMISRTS